MRTSQLLFLVCVLIAGLGCPPANDDDATANDDDAAADDDDATANDDDSSGDDDDSSGDDDDSSGDDDDATMAPIPLLDWAEDIGPALRTAELHDFVEASFLAASDGSCPATTNNSAPPPPAWYPAAPSQSLAPWQFQVPSLTDWTGSCSSSAAAWTGTGTNGGMAFSNPSAGCASSIGYCSHAGAWWEGSSLGADLVPGQTAGSTGLSLDGLVYTIVDSWADGGGCDNYIWADNVWRGATGASIEMAPGGVDAPTLLDAGTNELDWGWQTTNSKHTFGGGLIGCFPGDVSSLSATIVWYADSTPRTMVASLNWTYALGGQTGPTQFVGPAGCDQEPLSGTVTLTDQPSPGGVASETTVVTFDGASACDGCGSVTTNGAAAGTWCPTGYGSP